MSPDTAVVLAAGEGKRLRPLTRHRPKPMLPAGTKPILEYVFDALVDVGITSIVVVVGYGRTDIQSSFGSTYRDASLTYAVQERQLGTGHAVLEAREHVEGSFLVINGDQVIDDTLVRDVIDEHDATEPVATLGLLRRVDIGIYGGVLTEDGDVSAIVEAPRDDREYLLNAGVYAFEPEIFDAIDRTTPQAGEHLLVDAITYLIDEGHPVRGVESDGVWIDATFPWDLLSIATEVVDDRTDSNEPQVAPSATVHDTAVIRPPTVVAADCEIGPGAVVGPYVCLGENGTIESNAVVERSVIDTDARIGSNATLIDCVLGRGVHIGAGTVVPGGPADIRIGNRIHENRTLAGLFGDRVDDCGGVRYVPGSIVGVEVVVRAGETVDGRKMGTTEGRI